MCPRLGREPLGIGTELPAIGVALPQGSSSPALAAGAGSSHWLPGSGRDSWLFLGFFAKLLAVCAREVRRFMCLVFD